MIAILSPALLAADSASKTHVVKLNGHNFTLPVGMTIELVVSSDLVPRPVNACFGKDDAMFVTDSSGTNAKPSEQWKNPTHRVMKVTIPKEKGAEPKATVFADKLSFLQGILVLNEKSVLVATPPTIQKLTDTDGDGKADERSIWFDGGVLTGCANDVHGPYPGPDGRLYFTKGGFGKQTVKLGTGKSFTTSAAHIYSAKPDGSDLRIEMTGGMDNPVDVVFDRKGEMFFTTTFLQHPGNGKRDGLIHNTYGALFGKEHGPLNEHIRTRPELSEPMTHLGPAAPSGLMYNDSASFGRELMGNLFAAQFNLSKVSRHVLKPKGSTFETTDFDFVVSDNRDFHPTDVIGDGHSGFFIVDTGGWYKLCCPSSVLEKKDVLGAIYRVRRNDNVAHQIDVVVKPPRASLKSDSPNERALAAKKFGTNRDAKAIPDLLTALADGTNDVVLDTALTRALIDIGDEPSAAEALKHSSPRVVRAALVVLQQIRGDALKSDVVLPHLEAADASLRETAWWIAAKHPGWGKELAAYFASRTRTKPKPDEQERLAEGMLKFIASPDVQAVLVGTAADHGLVFLRAMARSGLETLPTSWLDLAEHALHYESDEHAHEVYRMLKASKIGGERYVTIAANRGAFREKGKQYPNRKLLAECDELELAYLASAPKRALEPSEAQIALLLNYAAKKHDASLRNSAVEGLAKAKLTETQTMLLADALREVSSLDIDRLLPAFEQRPTEEVGLRLLQALREPTVRSTLRIDALKPILNRFPQAVLDKSGEVYALMAEDRAASTKQLDAILKDAKPGDARRGQAVFLGAKAQCTACHKVHYVGGLIGPDLTKIGSIRSERDLLEAIVMPSASFVRSYEPEKIDLLDGTSYSGLVKSETDKVVTLATNATETVKINKSDIDKRTPGTVSIMPAGLDQQLTKAELLDLIAYLKGLK